VVCAGLLFAHGFSWLLVILLVLNIFWCAALPLVEATTLGHLTGRLADYGRIRVWGLGELRSGRRDTWGYPG
jgi:hypothetical protein